MSHRPFRLQMTVDGDRVDVGLSRFAAQLTDLREFWTRYAAPKLYRDIEDNFETEGRPVGGWQPLSPAYAAWKEKRYPGRPIMVRSGALKTSLSWANDRPGQGGVFDAQRKMLILGTKIKYAAYHQRGGTKPGRPPMRRLVFLLRNASDTLGRLLHAYAVDQAKAAGLRTRDAIRQGLGR